MQKIRIDFDNPGLPQHISAVENDSQSRFFQATLYENGKAYTAPEGAAYSIMYRGFGPQNQGWYDTINDGAGKRAACAVSGNVVTCEIARQALQVPGHVSIVLCVTTGKGYMLKSWPIECDCKNDRYDSTAEIQSFFYITQVSNADWNRAIQALEELKNTIDPTLSVSGKAADAAKVGEAVGQVKEDIGFLNGLVSTTIKVGTTLNTLGEEQSQSNRCVTDFIRVAGKPIKIIVPNDGSIKTRAFFYDENKVFKINGVYNNSSRELFNKDYPYTRIVIAYNDDSKADNRLLNSVIFYLPSYTQYHGNIAMLGVTAFSDCTDEGYYSFSLEDLPTIIDAPYELKNGGMLIVYPHSAANVIYQEVINIKGEKWTRYIGTDFKKMNADLIVTDYTIGSINSTTGENVDSQVRIRSGDIPLKHGIKATIPNGMKLRGILYYTDGLLYDTGWQVDSFILYPKVNANNSVSVDKVKFWGGYTNDAIITNTAIGKDFILEYIGNNYSPTWYALGDSITQGFYSYSEEGKDKIAVTPNCWVNLVAAISSYNLVNYGVGGSGYVHDGTVLDKQNAVKHVQSIDFSNADFVTIAYGVNDWKYNEDITTIKNNMKAVIDKIVSDNPYCKIIVVTPLNCRNTTKNYGTYETNWGLGYELSNSGTLQNVYDAIVEMCKYYGIEYIDLTHKSCINRISLPVALIDGIHPTLEAHKTIAHEIAKKINYV